jgi:Fe-S cluster assembly iron-binding protein IscA
LAWKTEKIVHPAMYRSYHYSMTTSSKTPASGSKKTVITPNMRVRDIQAILPGAEECMAQYGLHCTNCSIGGEEILEDGCRMHGMSDEDMNDLITDLNIMLSELPARPQTLTLTETAAHALKEVMQSEGKIGWGLSVGTDINGGFSMEFREKPALDDKIFTNDAVSDVQLFASSTTLAGIGGSTIDFRDGRFKLDLAKDKHACACGKGGACGGECDCGGGDACGCKHSE